MRTWARVAWAALAVAAMAFGGPALAGEAGEAAAPAATPVERLLPANTVAVIQAANLEKLGAAFEQSTLADAIKGSPLLTYLRTLAGAAAEFGATLLSGKSADELRACLGQHAALALLDFKDPQEAKERPPVVLLIEAADAKKLDSILTSQLQLFSLLSSEIALSERQEGGVTVHEVALPKAQDPAAYCFCGNFLVVGTRAGVSSLLRDRAADKPRLASDAVYQAIRRQLGMTAGLMGYLNVAALLEKAGIANHPGELMKLRALGVANVQGLGVALDFQGRQVRERLYLHTGGRDSGLLKLLAQGTPLSPTTAQFVPPHYTVYAAMALSDVGLWNRIRTMVADAAGEGAASFMDTLAAQAQQNIGIQVKEGLFDTIGDEAFLAVDLTQLGLFLGSGREPVPEEVPFLLGAKLQNAPALKETFDRIAANEALFEKGVERTRSKHGETDLFTFRIPMSAEVRPSYAILENALLFSIRPEAVGAAIDACGSKKSLAAAPAVQQGAAALGGPSHLRIEVNDAQLLTTLLGLVRKDLPAATQRLLPEFDKTLAGLHGYHAALRREPQGVSLIALSDLGTLGTLAVAGIIRDQLHAVVAKRVQADFEQFGTALEKYRDEQGAYPETLDQLVPKHLRTIPQDRFNPKRPYGYSRGQPDANGKLPDAWILISVGPDEKADIPVELFDPPAWRAKLQTQDPAEIERLKTLIYQFRKDQFRDERSNNDEGDLFRMGGRGLAPPKAEPRPE